MLRTILFSVIALTASVGVATAEPRHTRSETPVGVEVRGDDGAVLGHVTGVERNRAGRIVAASVPGLEPADAARAPTNLVAENDRLRIVSDHASRGAGIFEGGQERAR